jgi:hypothetical protein
MANDSRPLLHREEPGLLTIFLLGGQDSTAILRTRPNRTAAGRRKRFPYGDGTKGTEDLKTIHALSVLALSAALLVKSTPATAQGVAVIPLSSLPAAFSTLGLTPERIFSRYGRPAHVEVRQFCCRIGEDGGPVLTQAYDVDGGGRFGFLYQRPLSPGSVNSDEATWPVAGFAYDNLHAVRYLTIRDFFPTHDPRRSRLWTCVIGDAYHVIPGDSYEGNTVMAPTVLAAWSTTSGGMVVARYHLDRSVATYDPVTAQYGMKPPADLDSMRLLQIGYFPAPARIGDLSLAVDTDFSTLTPFGHCDPPRNQM